MESQRIFSNDSSVRALLSSRAFTVSFPVENFVPHLGIILNILTSVPAIFKNRRYTKSCFERRVECTIGKIVFIATVNFGVLDKRSDIEAKIFVTPMTRKKKKKKTKSDDANQEHRDDAGEEMMCCFRSSLRKSR